MIRVLVFGTFDILHPGHLNFFTQAKSLGDELFVVVALDQTVAKVKKRSTLYSEQERLQAVQAISVVKQAVLGNKDDKYRVIEEIKPDIIALGYDQEAFVDNLTTELGKRGLSNIKIVRLKAYLPTRYKSSIIRANMDKNR